jgi:N-acetylglucosaminyldiphosphoundecaprenol N-acetyl-beta-D-mannosaminyltransferase
MGLQFDAVSEREVVDCVVGSAGAGRGGWVITPNLEILRQVRASDELKAMCRGADLVVPDGMPLVWASRIQGTPLPERVAGSSLIWTVSERASQDGLTTYFIGGNPGAAQRATEVLRASYPGLRVAGVVCPPMGFERDQAELERLARDLRAAAPAIIFLGLPFPKQERLIQRLREVAPQAWFLGVGFSFSFVSGEVRRPSPLVQRIGLEWVYRLVQEPRRLFRRYVLLGLPFALEVLGRAAGARLRSATRR